MDPLRDCDDAHRAVTEYVAALPPELGGRAGVLKSAFSRKAEIMSALDGPRRVEETTYLKKKLVGIALQIGFHTGDLKRDWRN